MIDLENHEKELLEIKEQAMDALRLFLSRVDMLSLQFHTDHEFESAYIAAQNLFCEIESVKNFFEVHSKYNQLIRELTRKKIG